MTLVGLTKIFRTRQWWHTKVPMMLGVFCFSFLEKLLGDPAFIINLFLLLLWTAVTASFGFFLNEVFDHDQDIVAGKQNFTGEINRRNKLLYAVILAALSVSIWFLHPLGKLLMAVSAVQLLLFCLYSIPPFRLKESGWPGVLVDSLYAFVVPSIIAYACAKNHYSDLMVNDTLFLLCGWTLLAGFRNILNHQVKDRKQDRTSGVKNLANVYGVSFVLKICYSIVLLELPVFAVYLYFNPGNLVVKIIFLLVYFLFNSFSASRYGLRFNLKRKVSTFQFNFNSLYEVWLLIAATLLLGATDGRFYALLLFELVLFRNEVHYFIHYKILKPLFPFIRYRVLEFIWYRVVIWSAWRIWIAASLTVNYSIYYYRILILRQNENTARKIKPDLVAMGVELETRKPESGVKVEKKAARDISEINCPAEISADNLYVNGLWIGNRLSKVELLTIASFIRQGHRFRLWVYEPILTSLPAGLELMDANLILDQSKIFRYKRFNKYGHGKGSVSGFSDLFRYKLLYDRGGWWVDMDVTCLKPLNFETDYFFRNHHDLLLVGNVMKTPRACALMQACYEQASKEVNEDNTDWLKPVQILNQNVLQQNLASFVFKDFSNEDKWDKVELMAKYNKSVPRNYFLFHWMNEEWRSRGIDKNDIRSGSALGKLMMEYKLLSPPKNSYDKAKEDIRHLLYIPVYEYFS